MVRIEQVGNKVEIIDAEDDFATGLAIGLVSVKGGLHKAVQDKLISPEAYSTIIQTVSDKVIGLSNSLQDQFDSRVATKN